MNVTLSPTPDLFRSLPVGEALSAHPVTAIDVGSRGGFDHDLAPIAFAVNAIGFEPEKEAFEALGRQHPGAWRSVRHIQSAVGGVDGELSIHITRDPVSTSLLQHDIAIGERFGKPQFFDVVKSATITCRTLDEVASTELLDRPAYLKLDVEGGELSILQGSRRLLPDLLAIKTEVGFLRFRHGQPLACEIDIFLREQGFELMDFTGQTHWRIHGSVLHPHSDKTAIPFSRGQLMQGDYLFFRLPETVDDPSRLFQLASLSMAHGFFDHAERILRVPHVTEWLEREHRLEASATVAAASRAYGRMVLRQALPQHLRRLWTYARSLRNLLN